MLKHVCICGSKKFFVNRRIKMLQCVECKQRFAHHSDSLRWKKYDMPFKEKVKEIVDETSQNISEWIGKTKEISKKEWMKQFGIKKYKKKLVVSIPEHKEIDFKAQKEWYDETFLKPHIKKKWSFIIGFLNKKNSFKFLNTFHLGKLRGRHAARACQKDLRNIGIETTIKFTANRSAVLELKQ